MICGRATDVLILGDRLMHGSIPTSSVRHSILIAAANLVLAIGLVSQPDSGFSADAPAKPKKTVTATSPPPTKAVEAKRTPVTVRRAEFASAMILWFAIVMVGLAMVVLVMIMGRRLRNSLQRRPSASTVPDPLWYLKKNPKAVAHANQPDRTPDGESGPDTQGRITP
jgi:hypothetical protein